MAATITKAEITPPKAQSISISMINVDDESFRMTFCPDLKKLRASIEKIGLINPVILRRGKPFQIVSGYRRIVIAQSLGWEKIEAKVYASEELSVEEGFRLNLYENLGTRTFNLIEASMVVTGFPDRCGTDESQVRSEVLPLLGFQPGNKVLHMLSSLRYLSKEWKELVITKDMPLLIASKISRFSLQDQEVLLTALSGLHLGQNKMKECLEVAEEICRRDGLSLLQLFTAEPFPSLYQDDRLNNTERTEMFRKVLRARRYPELTRQQNHFQELRKKLSLPPSVTLVPPDFFEGDKLKVNLEFRSPEELQTILEKLETAADSEGLKMLLGML